MGVEMEMTARVARAPTRALQEGGQASVRGRGVGLSNGWGTNDRKEKVSGHILTRPSVERWYNLRHPGLQNITRK